jgi:hypothetical protein
MAYQVAFNCKTRDCGGVVVESEWMTDIEAYAHLHNHRKAQLTCEKCRKTHDYVPAIDDAMVRPWPVDAPKKKVKAF